MQPHGQEWWRPNRWLAAVIAAARREVRRRETEVGYYALVRAILALPDEDEDEDEGAPGEQDAASRPPR